MNFKVVIKANKSRDKKEKVISHYMDDDNYKNKLIMEFISIKEKYGSNEQLSFIPGRLLDFIQYMIYDYNVREFKTNAVDGLAQNTQDANGQAIVVVPRDIIKPIAQYISANDAQSIARTCKSANETANYTKKKSDELLAELKKVVNEGAKSSLAEINVWQEDQSAHVQHNI